MVGIPQIITVWITDLMWCQPLGSDNFFPIGVHAKKVTYQHQFLLGLTAWLTIVGSSRNYIKQENSNQAHKLKTN
jgi:hypothetical protein